MTQGVSSPQGSWLTPDWDVEPNVHALSTLRGGGLSAQAYASFNLAQHVGDDPEHVRANRALLRAAAKLPSGSTTNRDVHPHEALVGLLALLHAFTNAELPGLRLADIDFASRPKVKRMPMRNAPAIAVTAASRVATTPLPIAPQTSP